MEKKQTHIVIVPSPLLSLLVSALEFSKRLLHLHSNFHVTLFIPVFNSPPSSFLSKVNSLPPNIHVIFLPPITKNDMPPSSKQVVQMQLTVTKSLPSLRDSLISLSSKTPISALITDSFSFEVLDFAKELNALSFIYFPSSAMVLSLLFHMPILHDTVVAGEFRDQTEEIQIPGCVPIHGRDLPEPIQNRSSQAYNQFLQRGKKFNNVDGVLVNSFLEMEERSVRAFKEIKTPVYLIGPIISKTESETEYDCVRWLDNQPMKSVLYICFGGGGTLSQNQTNELALGLEQSGKRFLWIMRPPSETANIAYSGSETEDPLKFLPQGFLEKTKDRGLVIPFWAPQVEILKHGSIFGFLNNCGWNSIVESVNFGVPMIAWPLFAEQRMNAKLVSEEGVGMALRMKVDENGEVGREEIVKVIRKLMEEEEGKEIRRRMKEMKDAGDEAVKEDGSSTKALSELAIRLTNFKGNVEK